MATRLSLTTPCDDREGHSFHLRVEEASGTTAMVSREDVPAPWLRAACSCGWVASDDNRFTIEENAHWLWIKHVEEDPMRTRARLTGPQQALLDELRETGGLYIQRYGRYGRTATALVEKGVAKITEHDYSSMSQDRYEAI